MRHFTIELEELNQKLLQMGGLVESAIHRSVRSLIEQDRELAQQVIRDATDLVSTVAPWLQADHDGLTGKVLKQPERGEIDTPVQESLIVELYSK